MSDKDNNRSQANKYDKIFSENMRENLPGLIEHVLSLHIVTLEDLVDDIQFTKERETDLLKKVIDTNGNIFILHVEFQRKNDNKNMVYRMAEYSIMLQRKYRLPILQYVIYIGNGNTKMLTYIDTKDFQFRYHLTSLSSVDHRLFLKSDKIEEKMLSILGNLDQENPKLVLKQILLSIKNNASDELTEGRYIKQLHVLVQLRNLGNDLKEVMKTIEHFFKIERDPFYIEGQEKGIEKGEYKKAIEIAIELLKEKLPISFIAKTTKLSVEEIEQL